VVQAGELHLGAIRFVLVLLAGKVQSSFKAVRQHDGQGSITFCTRL
jgi:hypothetical protein